MRRKRRRMGGEGQPQEWGRVYKGKASWELQTVNSSNEMCKKSGLRLLLAFMFSWVASWQKGKRNLAGGVVLCGGWRASGGSGLERDLSLSSGEHHHHHHQTIFTFWKGLQIFLMIMTVVLYLFNPSPASTTTRPSSLFEEAFADFFLHLVEKFSWWLNLPGVLI